MSLYGDDQLALPPELVFTKLDADEALRDANSVLPLSERLFQESGRQEDPVDGALGGRLCPGYLPGDWLLGVFRLCQLSHRGKKIFQVPLE